MPLARSAGDPMVSQLTRRVWRASQHLGGSERYD